MTSKRLNGLCNLIYTDFFICQVIETNTRQNQNDKQRLILLNKKKKKFSKTCISKEIQIIHNTEPPPHPLPTTLVKNGPGYSSALTPVGYPIEVLC